MSALDFKSKSLILFTGAGFTKNFGGFLGQEIYYHLLNSIQSKTLKDTLVAQDNYNYEAAYSEVIEGNKYSIEEKKEMMQGVVNIYRMIDDVIRKWNFTPGSPYPVNIYCLKNEVKI